MSNSNIDLASRWKRLGGVIIDMIPMAVITLPFAYFFGIYDQLMKGIEMSFSQNMLIGSVGNLTFFLINYAFLKNNGQTIGKRILDIKIVNLDGSLPSVWIIITRRYLTVFFINYIPVVGAFINLIGILLIFGKERRCMHDHFAGTVVVNA